MLLGEARGVRDIEDRDRPLLHQHPRVGAPEQFCDEITEHRFVPDNRCAAFGSCGKQRAHRFHVFALIALKRHASDRFWPSGDLRKNAHCAPSPLVAARKHELWRSVNLGKALSELFELADSPLRERSKRVVWPLIRVALKGLRMSNHEKQHACVRYR